MISNFLLQVLKSASLMISLISMFYMLDLKTNISEKRLHGIFKGLFFTFMGVSIALFAAILQPFFYSYFFEVVMDVMVLVSLGSLVFIHDDVRDFTEEYGQISDKVQKFSMDRMGDEDS